MTSPRGGLALVVVCLLAGARVAGAQAAGVIVPPPKRARPAPPPRAADGTPITPFAARRDSLAMRQRLDIVAWVDSAAGALASGKPASTVPLAPLPAKPPRASNVPPPRRPS